MINFKIENISNIENELVNKAHEHYGIVFDNASNLVSLVWGFLSNSKVEAESWIFIYFLSQVQKFLTLSLLSTIRRHDIQSQMALRQVLESAVLGCYSLYKTEDREFGQIDSNGLLQINGNSTKKAYQWVENNYKDYSDKIKFMKKVINDNAAHASLLTTFNNADFKSHEIKVVFFDKNDVILTKARLWWIANISFGLLNLFSKVIHDYPLVRLVDDFVPQMRKLGAENEKIKQELIKEPKFSRWSSELK